MGGSDRIGVQGLTIKLKRTPSWRRKCHTRIPPVDLIPELDLDVDHEYLKYLCSPHFILLPYPHVVCELIVSNLLFKVSK